MRKDTITSILVLLVLFTACEDKDPEDVTSQVEFEVNILSVCFSGFKGSEYKELVIREEAAYQEFGEEIRIDLQNADCDTASLLPIDFSQSTLIGVHTGGGGCKADYQRTVIWDEAGEQVIYQVSAVYSGPCRMAFSHFNWALIPALPKNYTVKFDVSETNANP